MTATRKTYLHALPAEAVRERAEHARSGAAGIHSDQHTRREGALRGNRSRTRAARLRAAVADSRG